DVYDLNYFIPCRAKDRVIAYIGLGRTHNGDYLTSEDLELLETVSDYIGIALENARLYRSLEQKASEYESLKDFSENIIESINVAQNADYCRYHYRSHPTRRSSDPKREVDIDLPLGRQCRARMQYPARRHFELFANAAEGNQFGRSQAQVIREDYETDIPRIGNREQPPEFFSNECDRVCRSGHPPGDCRYAFAARSPIQKRSRSRRSRAAGRISGCVRQRRQTPASLSESIRQCARRNAGRWRAAGSNRD